SEDNLVTAAAEADVGIIPYLPAATNERLSCPNKLSQYLHAGLMIIANELPYVRSVVEQADVGLIYDSADLQTFAQAGKRVIDGRALRRACRRNGLRLARDDFNWQKHGGLFLKLYRGEFAAPDGASRASAAVPPALSAGEVMIESAGSHGA